MLNHLKDDYSTNRVLCQGDKAFKESRRKPHGAVPLKDSPDI